MALVELLMADLYGARYIVLDPKGVTLRSAPTCDVFFFSGVFSFVSKDSGDFLQFLLLRRFF